MYFCKSNPQKSEKKNTVKEAHVVDEEIKLSLFADNMILYTKNPKDTTRKLLELISEFGVVAGLNTEISWITINWQQKSEREIKEKIPFTVTSKRIKHLGINLPKETKYLYSENYKILNKEIKHDPNIWKNTLCSWIGRIGIVKMVILSKILYRVSGLPMKLPRAFFTELEQQQQQILQFLWKCKRLWIAHAILEKRNEVGEIVLAGFTFRHYYTGAVIKAAWSLHKNKNIDQQNRIEDLEINTCTYGDLIYDKEARIYSREKAVFSISGAGKTGELHIKEWN